MIETTVETRLETAVKAATSADGPPLATDTELPVDARLRGPSEDLRFSGSKGAVRGGSLTVAMPSFGRPVRLVSLTSTGLGRTSRGFREGRKRVEQSRADVCIHLEAVKVALIVWGTYSPVFDTSPGDCAYV